MGDKFIIYTEQELIHLLAIEKQFWEKSILHRWIERDGLSKVSKECSKLICSFKKSK